MVGSGYADGFERSRRRLARRESRGREVPGIRVIVAVRRRPRCSGVVSTRRSGSMIQAELNALRERELGLVGASGGNGEMNATHAGAHLSAELEELEANGLD